ncbi:hypothetical protein ACFC1T_08215 [Kitasatospora sp. NPDC056076]|uniref:hypothetical protein n=1 Tax=Kitasatospora sp. NPDC056076 TaxID=3345703 RepID=UPI0035D9EF6F
MIGIQTALHRPGEAMAGEMPARHQYRWGRCLLCNDGEPTPVAPGLFYAWGDGMASIPACQSHHESLVRFSRQQAMRASLHQGQEDRS